MTTLAQQRRTPLLANVPGPTRPDHVGLSPAILAATRSSADRLPLWPRVGRSRYPARSAAP